MARAPRTTIITLEETTAQTDPTLLRAAGIALGALRAAKVATLADLAALAGNGMPVRLSAEQNAMLERCSQPLAGLRLPLGDSDISTTLVVCSDCGEYSYVSSGATSPTKCAMTLGCEGSPRKPKPARRVRTVVAPPSDAGA